MKTKLLGVCHQIPNPKIQTVQRIASSNDSPIYKLKFHDREAMELWEFYSHANKLYGKENVAQINDLENEAWNNLSQRSTHTTKACSPIYGIDSEESILDDGDPWNMNNFGPSHSIIHNIPADMQKMPGIQTTYVNIGMKFTWFGIHCEDSDLASINFLHSGKPKLWYCVPAEEGSKLENLLMNELKDKFTCNTVYRHKCFLIPPSLLHKAGIKFSRIIQNPGEIIFTMYGAYHWGVNLGHNACESSNVASPRYRTVHANAKLCDQRICK